VRRWSWARIRVERDPNVGLQEDGATFTIPQAPVRRRIHGVQTFNVLRGGEYLFMPSLSALRWIGELCPGNGLPTTKEGTDHR
jgi:hypothetical protein